MVNCREHGTLHGGKGTILRGMYNTIRVPEVGGNDVTWHRGRCSARRMVHCNDKAHCKEDGTLQGGCIPMREVHCKEDGTL
jgi:hypothetical protein